MKAPDWLDRLAARRWPRRSVAWLGGLIIAGILAQAAVDLARSHDATVQGTVRELDAQARVLAEQAARSVQAVDVVLRHLATVHRSGALSRLADAELHALLREQAIGLGQVAGFGVHDAQGRPRAVSWTHPPPAAGYVGDQPSFLRIRGDASREVYVGDSTRGRVDGTWFFPIVRRLTTPDGAFDGIVWARGRVDYFQAFYRDVQPDPRTRIALLHNEGALLARHPPMESLLGKRMPQAAALFASAATGDLPARQVSPVDGVDRFGAVRQVPEYSLVVVVSRDAAAALAPWRAQAVGTVLRTVSLAGLAALLLVVVLRQLSRLHAARESLEASQERFTLAAEGADVGIWDWDLASDVLFLSPRAQRLAFAEAGEPLRPRRDWIARTRYHPDDVAPVRRALGEHLRGGTPHFSVEYRVQHHGGEWHWYRQRGVALRDAGGRAYRMAGSMEDITARKLAEAERDRLERQLRQAQKLEAIGTLAGGIAHDFNNILSAILGYGELAQKDAPEHTALRRHIDAAMSAGLRAKSLVERILAFSRSGIGERMPVHVQSVVEEALDAVAAALPAGVRLVRTLAAGDAGVLGDATQIHQVVMNLCANAVQSMKADGELAGALEAATLDAPRMVATRTLPAGAYVRIAVRDTGSGIAPQLMERIFDPFFTTKEVGVGTGLGLSLVHGIVTDLGGGIAVDSRVGAGTTMTVYLPSLGAVAPPAQAPRDAVPGGAGETVLLVDDEEPLVRLGEEMLAELGYEPVGFASSRAALAAFRDDPGRFDVVLSDEAMPDMTGSELVAEIRRLRPDVPVVLMSGYVSAALAQRARDAGVIEVLAKPLVARDIARALAAAVRRAALQNEQA